MKKLALFAITLLIALAPLTAAPATTTPAATTAAPATTPSTDTTTPSTDTTTTPATTTANTGTTSESTFFRAESTHYRVYSETSEAEAQDIANRLEAYLALFNQYFHFDLSSLAGLLRVRIFANESNFDSYLSRLISENRDDFVYVHYSDVARAELLLFPKSDSVAFNRSLIHQGFIQFLKTFVPNPPVWMREGFAIYFEESTYDSATSMAVYRENLAWLPTLKSFIATGSTATLLPLSEFLVMDNSAARQVIDVFYPQTWGFISFLLDSGNRDYARLAWDAISDLDPASTVAQNAAAVVGDAFAFTPLEVLDTAFESYIDGRQTFRDYVERGISLYSQEKWDDAESSFNSAIEVRMDNAVPFYYLGLINYTRGEYTLAEEYYRDALDLGAEEAISYYALGVNAFADNRYEQATAWLEQARTLDSTNFGTKVDEILARMTEID